MFLKTCLFLLILICIVLFIIFLTYLGYKNIPTDKDWIDFVSAIAPTIVGVLSLFIAFYSVFYTKQSIKSQEEQWLKNEFIKREAHLIIEFREKFLNTYNSISWFLRTFMQEYRCGNFVPNEQQLTIKIETFNYHYNKLKELYDLYNENPLIYQKFNIDKSMVYITAILTSIYALKGEDIKRTFVGRKKNALVYDCQERYDFGSYFVHGMDSAYLPIGKDPKIYFKILSKQKIENRFKKYINEAIACFDKLIVKLDEITTYHSGVVDTHVIRSFGNLYDTAEDYFKIHGKTK